MPKRVTAIMLSKRKQEALTRITQHHRSEQQMHFSWVSLKEREDIY
jgi:hypothetical protein